VVGTLFCQDGFNDGFGGNAKSFTINGRKAPSFRWWDVSPKIIEKFASSNTPVFRPEIQNETVEE